MQVSQSAAARFLAVDVFRGMTVAFMIIVNTPGSWDAVYAPLLHANWHGLTPTDLVFPCFLFAVGNALSFTLPKYASLGQGAFLQKTLKRTVLLFAIGVLLYWLPFFKQDAAGVWHAIPFSETRLPGVLQRIALTFGLASLLIYYCRRWQLYLVAGLLLVGYWFILAQWGDYSLAGNAARKFDIWLLGEAHLYRGEGIAFDPEGILSTLPALVNVLAGYWAGQVLQQACQSDEQEQAAAAMRRLVMWGGICVLLACLWHLLLPINKKLWTSSYVLVTTGIAIWALAALQVILARWAGWSKVFLGFGRNTLGIYLLSQLIVIALFTLRSGKTNAYDGLFQQVFLPLAGKYNGSFLFALSALLVCWLVAYALDKQKIYLKI